MDNIEELKKARANTKRKVTVLIKKFKTSVHYGNEDSKTIYQNLDEEYYKLLDIQLQIEEGTAGEERYMEVVDKDYADIVEKYHASQK